MYAHQRTISSWLHYNIFAHWNTQQRCEWMKQIEKVKLKFEMLSLRSLNEKPVDKPQLAYMMLNNKQNNSS